MKRDFQVEQFREGSADRAEAPSAKMNGDFSPGRASELWGQSDTMGVKVKRVVQEHKVSSNRLCIVSCITLIVEVS